MNENKFIVLNVKDAENCLTPEQMEAAKEIINTISAYRSEIGKDVSPTYYVVNTLEPYAERIKEIIEGHTDKTDTYSEQFEKILKTIKVLHVRGEDVRALLDVNGDFIQIHIAGVIKDNRI